MPDHDRHLLRRLLTSDDPDKREAADVILGLWSTLDATLTESATVDIRPALTAAKRVALLDEDRRRRILYEHGLEL